MSYQVIARKYRPQRFSDVVGQEHVTQTLSNAIQQNRIAHAYLFVGPRGTGKTTIARIFAKCLNSTGGPQVDFPENDPRVQEIAEGRSLDVLEIDGASNRGIEEIRELRETVRYAPATGRFKIYIIDEVHMLTKEAFNALLKTLEEPPAHVKFMFATTEAEKVLPTILSRCQRFDLRRIPTKLVVEHLGHIAQLEKVQIDAAALHAIARGCDGCMRDAESTLDQLISFCGDRIAESDVLSMFGLAGRAQILDLARAVLAGETEIALRQFDQLARSGKDLARLLGDLLNYFRNLLLILICKGDLSLIDVTETEVTALEQDATCTNAAALTRVMEVLSDFESRFREISSRKILFEVALLKAIEARQAVPIDELIRKLNDLRGAAKAGNSSAEESVPEPVPLAQRPPLWKTAASSAAARPIATQAMPLIPSAARSESNAPPSAQTDLQTLWANLIEAIGKVSPFTKTYLLEAHPVSIAKNIFTIGFDPQFGDHLGLVDNQKNRALLQTKLQELGLSGVQVKFIQAEGPANVTVAQPALAAANSPAPAAARQVPESATSAAPATAGETLHKDDFKNDPLIKQALEIFRGQIVDARA